MAARRCGTWGYWDDQQLLFGRVASATACRAVDAVAADEQAMARIGSARKAARHFVWHAEQAPPVVAAAAGDGQARRLPLAICYADLALLRLPDYDRPRTSSLLPPSWAGPRG